MALAFRIGEIYYICDIHITNKLTRYHFMGFFDFMTEDIAIDLGTANTLIIHKGKVVVDSPSIVAMDRTTNKIIAIGHRANQMQGKTHENIKTIRPLKDGVIADFEASEANDPGVYQKYSYDKKAIFQAIFKNGDLYSFRHYGS